MNHDNSVVYKETYNDRDHHFQGYGGCLETIECGQIYDGMDAIKQSFNVLSKAVS